MDTFFQSVYQIVQEIPKGRVATYGQIARLLEQPHNARVVGWAMRQAPSGLPSHRVIKKSGEPSPDLIFDGKGTQRERLEAEGIPFLANGQVHMELCLWER
ncbi:MGMT family protein [Alkalicoccobacillus murimartini]|uniref:Methylated-DNA-protein-cysteine methyltransferase-like protein n=1 Tax=Alkalicoccobacillus murimartini TaxID=171685 RepID=A0ABT9YIL3_9BACI|nr:methylated-DNA--[protein]-cysteine S-methyltransferase [Alkalicoccobacillus murimartini]MDQ0207698.1 methylated-DNA-protein-cysteine methyltransferase-like protein [Alkalicoccobacillus murimartini]